MLFRLAYMWANNENVPDDIVNSCTLVGKAIMSIIVTILIGLFIALLYGTSVWLVYSTVIELMVVGAKAAIIWALLCFAIFGSIGILASGIPERSITWAKQKIVLKIQPFNRFTHKLRTKYCECRIV